MAQVLSEEEAHYTRLRAYTSKNYKNNDTADSTGVPKVFINLQITKTVMIYRGHVLDTQWDIPQVEKVHIIEFENMMFYLKLIGCVKDILLKENLLHECMHKKLVNYVYAVARACVKSGLKSSKIERIDIVADVKVQKKINIPNNVEEYFARVQSESMEDDKKFRFRASKASINMLERKKYEKEEELEACCTVCMEDFLTGEDIIVMPCKQSHIFHEKCILKWLEESHVCPLCRFELPYCRLIQD